MAAIWMTVSSGFALPPGIGRGFKPVIVAKFELSSDWQTAKEEGKQWMEKFQKANPGIGFHGQITMSDWV